MIFLLDDFHNIHTVRLPETNLKLSVATHMVSSLLEVHTTVPAVVLPSMASKIHSTSTVTIKGINNNNV
jgi:hypothetical protein